MCNKTEFGVEGWRKLFLLVGILDDKIPSDVIQNMELKFYLKNGQRLGTYTTIKNSWIYDHFTRAETKNAKISIFVNSLFPIDQNLDEHQIASVGNHCVLVKGIARWENENNEIVECFELETHDRRDQTKFIPVEYPSFEEVQAKINEILQNYPEGDNRKESLNKYGEELAQMKNRSQLDTNCHNEQKYHMLFVRAEHPSYQLEFTA